MGDCAGRYLVWCLYLLRRRCQTLYARRGAAESRLRRLADIGRFGEMMVLPRLVS